MKKLFAISSAVLIAFAAHVQARAQTTIVVAQPTKEVVATTKVTVTQFAGGTEVKVCTVNDLGYKTCKVYTEQVAGSAKK